MRTLGFNTRGDVEQAARLCEEAARDMRRALDSSPGQWSWSGYQEQAQGRLMEVAASMDMGSFELPHPWDLRPRDDTWVRADDAMNRAVFKTSLPLVVKARRHARAWKALARAYRKGLDGRTEVKGRERRETMDESVGRMPLGVMYRAIWIESVVPKALLRTRLEQVRAAIERSKKAGMEPLEEWVKELSEHPASLGGDGHG